MKSEQHASVRARVVALSKENIAAQGPGNFPNLVGLADKTTEVFTIWPPSNQKALNRRGMNGHRLQKVAPKLAPLKKTIRLRLRHATALLAARLS